MTCLDCAKIPLFPNWETVTAFRMRCLRESGIHRSGLPVCTDFVAVSYCWQGLGEQATYTIVEEDGTTRRVSAPKNIIDRTAQSARHNWARMIWIDQECIPQDETIEVNRIEKEKAVQALDLVYSRAAYSMGILNTGFEG